MSLTIYVGSANADCSSILLNRLGERSARGERACLLLPSAPDVADSIARLAERAPLGLAMSTFDDYLDEVWQRMGDGRHIVTPVQRLALLEETVKPWHATSTLAPIRPAALLRALARLVQRAAEAPDLPDELQASDSAGSDLLRAVALYAEQLRSARLIERAAAHRWVVGHLDGADTPPLIAIDRFTGLTAAQEAFVLAASSLSEVMLTLTYVPELPATLAAEPLIERLITHGATLHNSIPSIEEVPLELAQLEGSLGRAGGSRLRAEGAVILSEAWGEQSEAARITAEVQNALAGGVHPGDIAVVFRDAASHLRELRLAFAEAEVLAEYDVTVPFKASGLGRLLLGILEIRGADLSHRRLMDLLRSPYSPLTHESLDALDAAARRARGGGAGFSRRWGAAHDPVVSSFLEEMLAAARAVAGEAAERRWYALISGMLSRARLGQSDTALDALLDAAAARTFIEALRGLSSLPAGEPSAAGLTTVLQEATIALRSEGRRDHVQVMRAERARGRRYRCVIVGGLTADEFPSRQREDAFSAPEVAASLARHQIDVAPRSSLEQERLLYYQVATRASERLVLSWQSHSAEGRPLRPSIFLEEVLDLYREPLTGELGDDSPPHHLMRIDNFGPGPGAPSTVRRTLRGRLASRDEGDVADARRRALPARIIASDAVQRLMADREAFSASEIETYLQCPYRWYLERIIRPQELDARIDRAATGRLGHAIMNRFYEEFIHNTGQNRVSEATLEIARAVYAEVAAREAAAVRPQSAAESAAARTVVRAGLRVIEDDAHLFPGMAPVLREWSFGMEEGDTPESFGDFALRGRIDRIDLGDSTLVVTDYKLGGVGTYARAGFEKSGIVQIPLYAAVAARRLGRTVAGGIYRSLTGSGKPRGFVSSELDSGAFVRTDVVERVELEELVAGAIARAAEAVARMREGEIEATPPRGGCPSYCTARSFCTGWRPGRG